LIKNQNIPVLSLAISSVLRNVVLSEIRNIHWFLGIPCPGVLKSYSFPCLKKTTSRLFPFLWPTDLPFFKVPEDELFCCQDEI
jgi:hypothetical protein